MPICSIYRLCNPKGCCYLRLNAPAAPLPYFPSPDPTLQLPAVLFHFKIKASANPITRCQSLCYRRHVCQGESLARATLLSSTVRCHRVIALFVVAPCYSLHTFFYPNCQETFLKLCLDVAGSFLTSLSRVRERLVMGRGLMEAERTGGCGEEEEEDDVRMGGEADEDRVGG